MRTAVLGEPSSEIQSMCDVVLQALNAAIAAIRPGVTAGSVDQACRGLIEDAGMEANVSQANRLLDGRRLRLRTGERAISSAFP